MSKLIRLLVVMAVLGGSALGVYAWIKSRDNGAGQFKTVEAQLGSITEKALATGQIDPRLKFTVKSKISGIVRRVSFEVGDRVQPGAILFEIAADPTPSELIEAERRVDAAQATFAKANADMKRVTQLADEGVISRGDRDATIERFEQAKIELSNSKDSLELIRKGRIEGRGSQLESLVRAPAAGTVLSRSANVGDPIVPLTSYQAGTEMATIAEMSDLLFKGTVDEIDVGKLHVGLPAQIKIGSLPDKALTGRLIRIAPQAKEKDNARLFDVEIALDPGQKVELRAGYSATADLIIREKKDVVTIPERLVTFEEKGAKAFVEIPSDGPNAEPKKVEIKTGLSDGLQIEVVSGLAKGDKVVERPPREIKG